MESYQIGRATYHTRVEAWECDHNQHWNVRNYMRSFEQANHVVASAAPKDRSGGPTTLHARFHRELFAPAAAQILSAQISDGPMAGWVLHNLWSEGRLSATALSNLGFGATTLSEVSSADVSLAMPRSLAAGGRVASVEGFPSGCPLLEMGLVQPADLTHDADLHAAFILRLVAAATSHVFDSLGLTTEAFKQQNIGRMGVEVSLTRFTHVDSGTRLRGLIHVRANSPKSIAVRCALLAPDQSVVAATEHCILLVDMATRHAIALPEFVRQALTQV